MKLNKEKITDKLWQAKKVIISLLTQQHLEVIKVTEPGVPLVDGVRRPDLPNNLGIAEYIALTEWRPVSVSLGDTKQRRMLVYK